MQLGVDVCQGFPSLLDFSWLTMTAGDLGAFNCPFWLWNMELWGSTGRLSSDRDSVGESEALVELNLARDIKDNKKTSTGMSVVKGRAGKTWRRKHTW